MAGPTGGIPNELIHCRPKLRADIRCCLQSSANQPYYQIEDPLVARFYRLGAREWKVADQFRGNVTLGDILRTAPRESSLSELGQQDILMLCRWLVQMQLVEPDTRLSAAWPAPPKPNGRWSKWLTNPVFLKIPLFNPDRLLDRCLPWVGWTVSRPAVIGWALLLAAAGYALFSEWDRFSQPIGQILAPDNWLYLLIVWIGLKVVHEFYHGLICKKYGGHVTSCGLMLILFSPVAYVDVTSSWRFRSRWHRIYTAFGGIYAEFLVSSLAALLWSITDEPVVSQLCHNVITMAGVSTLLFNGNFLMKYDGYYIVSDLLEIQNLYSAGQQYIRYLGRRYLLGVSATPPADRTARRWIIQVYGVASLIWRCLFYAGILFTAAILFHGAGIAISITIAIFWFLGPALKLLQYLIWGSPNEQPQRWRFCGIALVGSVLLYGLMQLPWPGGIVASGLVEYEPLHLIRAESPGFVDTVHVRPGERVAKGQLLVTLRNDQITSDLADVEFAIQQSDERSRMLQSAGEQSHFQVEQKRRESLERQRRELAARVEQLEIRTPAAGRVISHEVDSWVDQYLSPGTTIFCVGDEQHKAIQVAVPQRDADLFLRQLGEKPRVRVRGRAGLMHSPRLTKVQPQATRHLAHPALAAPHGGPLAVVPRASNGRGEALELLEPHFQAVVSLSAEESTSLRAGQLARVRLQAVGESIGQHLWNELQRWVRRKLES